MICDWRRNYVILDNLICIQDMIVHGVNVAGLFAFRPIVGYYTMRFPYVALAIKPNEMNMQRK